MTHHAKASSAGSTLGQGSRLGSFVSGALATRASSFSADGSGAPSFRSMRRGRVFLAVGATALLSLFIFTAFATASKQVTDYFGTASGSGTKGGEFSFPIGVAVNETGAGPADQGDIYVAEGNNSRIQRFDSSGNFISAWGGDVLNPRVDEVQTLTVNATGGTFKLSFDGESTGNLAYDASAGTIQTALFGLPNIGGGNASVDVGDDFSDHLHQRPCGYQRPPAQRRRFESERQREHRTPDPGLRRL